jgi:hypothetical protein
MPLAKHSAAHFVALTKKRRTGVRRSKVLVVRDTMRSLRRFDMKTRLITAICAFAATAALAGDVIKRGQAIPAGEPISVAKVMEKPDAYSKDPVLIEGRVETACTNKGCWMQLASAEGQPGMRVTFKDYGFFVPLDSKGAAARAYGITKVKTLSKEQADHLEGEGAKLTRNADGTAREVSFVASGVELRR